MKSINRSAGLRPINLFKLLSLSWLKKSTIVEIISFLFIILFLYTGISKIADYELFQEQLADSPILKKVASLVVWVLPLTEFLISVLLFVPKWRLKGLYATLVMMVLFTAYVITLFSIDRKLPCSCGGIIQALSWEGHLVFNGVMTLLAAIAIKISRQLN